MTTATEAPRKEQAREAPATLEALPPLPPLPPHPDGLPPVLRLAGYDDEDSGDWHICRGID